MRVTKKLADPKNRYRLAKEIFEAYATQVGSFEQVRQALETGKYLLARNVTRADATGLERMLAAQLVSSNIEAAEAASRPQRSLKPVIIVALLVLATAVGVWICAPR